MKTLPPWVLKGRAGWNEDAHKRGQPGNAGQFGPGGGGGGAKPSAAGAPTERHSPALDAFWDEPAESPKPAAGGDLRASPTLDAFWNDEKPEPKPEAKPQAGPGKPAPAPSNGPPQEGQPDAARGKASADTAAAHMKMAQAAQKAGDHETAQKFLQAAYAHHMAAQHHAAGEHGKADAAKATAAKHLEGVGAAPSAKPAQTPAGPGARAFPHLSQGKPGKPAAKPAPPPLPGKPGAATPPALPHHRSHQDALKAANAVVQASRGGGDVKAAHGAAMKALDEHLKTGLAELDRRGGAPQHKAAFAAKIRAARAKLNQLAGVDGDHRSEPRESVRRPAVKPQRPRSGFSRKGAPPWVTKAGRWVTIGAQEGDDGEKHGGARVYIEGGKITRGPKHMVGHAPDKIPNPKRDAKKPRPSTESSTGGTGMQARKDQTRRENESRENRQPELTRQPQVSSIPSEQPDTPGAKTGGKKMTLVNGKPLDPKEAAGRAEAFAQQVDYFTKNPDRREGNVEPGAMIQHGLMGGLSPERIRADLESIGVDGERVANLLSRRIAQWKITFADA